MSKKDLLAKGLENLGNMINNAESERLSEQENSTNATERRTVITEAKTKQSTKINRTVYPAQETPQGTIPSEPTNSERERVLQNLRKNPTGKKRPTVALKGRAKDARTYREAFQMTADLGEKLDGYIKANGLNKSEFIRRAIARELGKVKDDM